MKEKMNSHILFLILLLLSFFTKSQMEVIIEKEGDYLSKGFLQGINKLVFNNDKKAQTIYEEMKKLCNNSANATTLNSSIPVSNPCCDDMMNFLKSLLSREKWALQMFDSMAKLPSGLLMGNTYYPGDFNECKGLINYEFKNHSSFLPKYCTAEIFIYYEPFKRDKDFRFGLCVPNSCSEAESKYLFEEDLFPFSFNLDNKYNASVSCSSELPFDTKAIIAATLCGIIFLFLFSGTVLDLFQRQPIKEEEEEKTNTNSENNKIDSAIELTNPENGTENNSNVLKQESKVFSCLKKFLLCFSIVKNSKKLMNTKLSEGTIPALHGIRFLSMAWIILGHTYFTSVPVTGNYLTLFLMGGRFSFQVISKAIYAVDTFFLLSGMLVCYGTFRILSQKERKMNWCFFYLHRFLRLSPTYYFTLMFYLCFLKYFGFGPFWYSRYDSDCSSAWLFNVFYINNFIPGGGCMGWTWYLACDMQFYLISPIILILLYKRPRLAIFLISFLIFSQVLSIAVIFYFNNIKSSNDPAYMDQYMKPHYRIGPYLIGILLGYYLHITKCKKNLNKIFVGLMWIGSFLVMFLLIYGLYNTIDGETLSHPVAILYWTLNHIAWALPVAWIIFACCTGYGGFVNRILSWKVFIPLSRLTYCAYLIHQMMMMTIYMNLLYPKIITDSIAITEFFGLFIMSYGFSFFLSMFIEVPLMKLQTVFLRGKYS